jgi:hypothetical protein
MNLSGFVPLWLSFSVSSIARVYSGVNRCGVVFAATLLLLIATRNASAQSDNRFALGAEVTLREQTDRLVHGHNSIGLLWRLGQGETGWGWKWGFNWFSADISQSVGGAVVPFGHMHVRPLMVGYGYNYRRGRDVFIATVHGGYAFVSMTLAPQAVDAYNDRLGAQSVTLSTPNTFVVRPGVSVWHDVNRKIGLHMSSTFMVARPLAVVDSTRGRDERRIRADMFQVTAGLAYSIF